MKFAICNEVFRHWPWENQLRYAKKLGYEGVEIAPFTFDTDVTAILPGKRAWIRDQAKAVGMNVVGLHWLFAFRPSNIHLTSPYETYRRPTALYLGALARFCGDIGGKVLVLGSPQQRNLSGGVPFEKGVANAAAIIKSALPRFEEAGVTLAIEPLGPQETNFINTAAEARVLISAVNSPWCRLHLDVKAMTTEKTPVPDIIRSHISRLAHFHANDPNLLGPGMGEVDFVPIFQALEDVQYDGWVSVEVFKHGPGIGYLARESINYMRRCQDQVS